MNNSGLSLVEDYLFVLYVVGCSWKQLAPMQVRILAAAAYAVATAQVHEVGSV